MALQRDHKIPGNIARGFGQNRCGDWCRPRLLALNLFAEPGGTRQIDLGRPSQDMSMAELSSAASRLSRSRQVSTAALASLIFSRNASSL